MGAAMLVGVAQAHPEAAHLSPSTTLPRSRAAAHVTDPRAASVAGMPQREALLEAAETALARGMVSTAILGFEQAAMMLHAADTEMGLVRAWMQAGEYRRALAFCAHTAGAHLDSPAASALYVWLLRMGGQDAFARRVLVQTFERAPGDPVVDAVRQALESPSPAATGLLLDLPHRMAPLGTMQDAQPAPGGAQLVSSGVLMGDGLQAMVPLAAIAGARRLWVRNGLGHTTEAAIDATPEALRAAGFAVLRLASKLDSGAVPLAPKDAFAGSPGYVIAYAATRNASPAWPWLGQGFFGGFDGAAGMRKLGIALPAELYGGPVLNAYGELAGISVQGAVGQATMLPVSMFAAFARENTNAAQSIPAVGTAPAMRMASDEVYERALRITLQVIVLP